MERPVEDSLYHSQAIFPHLKTRTLILFWEVLEVFRLTSYLVTLLVMHLFLL